MPWISPIVGLVTSTVTSIVSTLVTTIVTATMSSFVVKVVTWVVYAAVVAALSALVSMFLYAVTGADFFLQVITVSVAVITICAIIAGIATGSLMVSATMVLALIFPLYLLAALYEKISGDDNLIGAISTGVREGVELPVNVIVDIVKDVWDGLMDSDIGSWFTWALVGLGLYVVYKTTTKSQPISTKLIQTPAGV